MAKKETPKRNKVAKGKFHITVSQENYQWVKENHLNLSSLIDKFLTEKRTSI